jgi:hypothetical protein
LAAILVATVAAKPIVTRSDDTKAPDDYKKCCEERDKWDSKRVCEPPSKPTPRSSTSLIVENK